MVENCWIFANLIHWADNGIGKYTYVGSTGCSVIDYGLVTPILLNVIQYFIVKDPNILSDHCWFKQYFICSFTSKQTYTLNVSRSDGKLEAYTSHFLVCIEYIFVRLID